ncbi:MULTISPECIES: hypothetical protein [Methylobacterium]|uniref:Serine/threonine protein kinase n=1 Tax=Methylobacterium jeotgali TaxID=381630 RepID=A0ABQ4SYQ5_9HYPH|nr:MULTISPECIES: hypothetical protein [Methylobacterium]PIU08089.1 MAG: hypothetical protein COT56_02640 [Methylobacterium sp. CG09_land_8_20_14_0_10_71_15]PIU15544.1 MAG: hypothetical protein COT28_03965 [Methylobacterium sp. CG08_land_8_20_14_0_20_71_15]GBU19445.1 hypothetical protein AwMethylo_36600 [Methylobacterium sp.]GJE07669.1 hypothetical protein AOPFMNJM_2999 [Methylobacterium jeotgali]
MHRLLPGVALLAASLFATAASAQNPDAPLKGRDSDPNLPSQTQTPPDKVRPDDGSAGNLTDRLEKSDGVIKPPGNAAEGMVVRPPETGGSTPVIKPNELPGRQPGTEAR